MSVLTFISYSQMRKQWMSSNVKNKSLAARKLNDLNRMSTIGKFSLILLIEDNNIKKQNDQKGV